MSDRRSTVWRAFIRGSMAAFVVGFASIGCGGSPTRPSDPVQQPTTAAPQQGNLGTAPRDAHSLTSGDVTIRYWFDFTPARGGVVVSGSTYTIKINCRRPAVDDRIIIFYFDLYDSQGTLLVRPSPNIGVPIRLCDPESNVALTERLTLFNPTDVKEMRVRVWMKPWPAGQPAPVASGDPDMLISEVVNWRFPPR